MRMTNGFVISGKNYKKLDSVFYTTHSVYEGVALDEVRNYEQGYFIGLGGILKNFSIEARYEKSNGMAAYVDLNSIVDRFYFLTAYKF